MKKAICFLMAVIFVASAFLMAGCGSGEDAIIGFWNGFFYGDDLTWGFTPEGQITSKNRQTMKSESNNTYGTWKKEGGGYAISINSYGVNFQGVGKISSKGNTQLLTITFSKGDTLTLSRSMG